MDLQDKILIRPCSPEQVETLQKISIQTFSDTFAHHNDPQDFEAYLKSAFSASNLSAQLKNPHSEFYFCYIDQLLVGYLKVNFNDAQTELKRKDSMEIERIYVIKAMQGKRIGLTLMDFALKKAASNSIKTVWLGVWEKNPKAIAFYTQKGFIMFDKHTFKMGQDLQTDILMKIEI